MLFTLQLDFTVVRNIVEGCKKLAHLCTATDFVTTRKIFGSS